MNRRWMGVLGLALVAAPGLRAQPAEPAPPSTSPTTPPTPTTLPAPTTLPTPTTTPAESLGTTRPASASPPANRSAAARRPAAEPAAPNPIPAAVKLLLAEFDDAQAPNRTLPRSKSDFFPTADTQPTPDQIWKALDSRHSANPRADAYVKWQLLSGLPANLTDDKSVQRLAALFQRAPLPTPQPLLDQRTRSEMEAMKSRLRLGSEDQANDRIRELTDKAFEQNRPIFSYREELIARLPNSGGRFVLTFEEVAARAKAGWRSERMRDRALTDIRSWSVSATPAEVQLVAQNLQRLRTVESEEFPIRLRSDGSSLIWDRERARVEAWDNTVQALITELNNRSRSPGQRR